MIYEIQLLLAQYDGPVEDEVELGHESETLDLFMQTVVVHSKYLMPSQLTISHQNILVPTLVFDNQLDQAALFFLQHSKGKPKKYLNEVTEEISRNLSLPHAHCWVQDQLMVRV